MAVNKISDCLVRPLFDQFFESVLQLVLFVFVFVLFVPSCNWFKCEIGRAHVWTPVTRPDLVCRLLLEKKKKKIIKTPSTVSVII